MKIQRFLYFPFLIYLLYCPIKYYFVGTNWCQIGAEYFKIGAKDQT
nr:MAG TPA: hypothetical protein [Caudoviricetes sp.]